ncbi:unnamed protein product [Caenorhabditis bovis]|uniref:Calpain catalytic domain-containing protein n=1 Tax=Caenorhabditis bovis TaxID=2654633 RepID=A0A8S1EM99_9PELO|nr:unnamed protein product [Caenorhabditis bovis]
MKKVIDQHDGRDPVDCNKIIPHLATTIDGGLTPTEEEQKTSSFTKRVIEYKKRTKYGNKSFVVSETVVEHRSSHRVIRHTNGRGGASVEVHKYDHELFDLKPTRITPIPVIREYKNGSDYELNYDQYLPDEAPVSKAPKHQLSRGFSCYIKGLFDGFDGKDIPHIIRHIRRRYPKGGQALTNCLLSGKMERIVDQRIRDFIHHFSKINPDTGRIIGSIRGNDFFHLGGLHNNLGNTGKIYLDNLMRGKCRRRRVHRFRKDEPILPAEEKKAIVEEKPIVKPSEPKKKILEVEDYGLDFETERDRCLREKILFEDPEFPATNKSLYYSTPPKAQIVWKRPGDIVSNPQLIVQGESRFDVKQGALGDCWFLAALANITLYDALFYRVVPPDQSFTDNYAGIFHFQFWHYGRWVDVVVDDRLPTVNGKLYYLHSETNNEFWSALVEKAYAKLHGGYENLDGGTTAEALEDFTGGLTEYFDLRKVDKAAVLAELVKGMEMGSLFGCSIDADSTIREAQLSNGLVCGHAYSITAIHSITYCGENITVLRLRNPWGNDKEWNGAWSDRSSEWTRIDEPTKKLLSVSFAKDGEFWMSFDDFFANFTQMEVCNLSAEIFDEISEMTGVNVKENQTDEVALWNEHMEHGAWDSKKGTAGGCLNNQTTYHTNPQYASYFSVPQNSVENDGNVTVIVAVLQKYRRELRSQGKDLLPIGVSIYKSDGSRKPLPADFFRRNRPVARSSVFVNTREVTVHFRVTPGEYIVIPSTFDPYDDAEFLLRIYSNGPLNATFVSNSK